MRCAWDDAPCSRAQEEFARELGVVGGGGGGGGGPWGFRV
jgi:hypothetical protein